MSVLAGARKIARMQAAQSEQYLQDQSRRLVLSGSVLYVANPETGEALCAQEPMRAIERITGVSSECGPSVIERTYETTPKPRLVLPSPGSPVDLTVGEIQRMTPEDRAIALARVMAVDGARERMKPDGERTLTQALADELEYQRAMIRAAKTVARKGESERHTKTQSKVDRKAGRPRAKQAGTASFKKKTPTRVSIQLEGTHLTTGRSPADPEYGYCIVEKRAKNQPDILAKNAKG